MVQFVWGGGDSYGRGFEASKRKGLKGDGIYTDSQALMKRIGSRHIEKGAEIDNLKRTLMLISIGRRKKGANRRTERQIWQEVKARRM